MTLLNAQSFAKACHKRPTHIDVPCAELGGDIRLGRLNAAMLLKINRHNKAVQRDADGNVLDEEALANYYVTLLAMAIIDEDGNRYLLSDEGKAQLASLNLASLVELGTAAMQFNNMGDAAASKKKPRRGGTSPTTTTP